MKDAINRRKRFSPPQPGKRFRLTPRDYAILEKLDRHGYLPTNFIYELTKHIGRDYTGIQHRLTKLYNGFCPHPDHHSRFPDGHTCKPNTYIARHPEQKNNFQARYQPMTYHISPLGRSHLPKPSRFFRRSNSFIHDFFLGCFTASAELQAHRFIFRDEIRQHANCPNPETDFVINGMAPDDIFGVEYEGGGFRFFVVEVDRAHERIHSSSTTPASIAKKLKAYEQALVNQEPRTKFGLPTLSFLFATTTEERAKNMTEYARNNIDPKYHTRFLFKAFPNFGDDWLVPREALPVMGEWMSASGPVDISRKAP